jgi:hypothetical protein
VRICRASRYLEKSAGAETRNEKALAETESQELANQVHSLWDPSWNYVSTEHIDGRWLHHYQSNSSVGKESHVWFCPNV